MSGEKMNFNATWSMAVGGMIGGGIFSVLGVIIETAGQWAWLSFLIAGGIALISAHSYSQLAIKYREGGGAFTFLRKINYKGFAGSLSWILILGYILTLSVYAFTFGHYVAHVFHIESWLPRVLGLSIIVFLTGVNLKGVSNASNVEIFTVYGKLIVLLALAAYGLFQWYPEQLMQTTSPKSWHMAIIGAGTIFMAYEGFQLVSYDYKDIKNPNKTLPEASIWSVISVILVYILVAVGATMVVGTEKLIENKEVSLSIAGKEMWGAAGSIIVTIAAAFSTASAINATLFSTARLMESVAEKKDLPHLFVKENKNNIPLYSVLWIAGLAAILAIIGSLTNLVDAASIVFLFTFGVVNFIAYKQKVKRKWLSLVGAICSGLAIISFIAAKIQEIPYAILGIILFSLAVFLFRPYILKKMNAE